MCDYYYNENKILTIFQRENVMRDISASTFGRFSDLETEQVNYS